MTLEIRFGRHLPPPALRNYALAGRDSLRRSWLLVSLCRLPSARFSIARPEPPRGFPFYSVQRSDATYRAILCRTGFLFYGGQVLSWYLASAIFPPPIRNCPETEYVFF